MNGGRMMDWLVPKAHAALGWRWLNVSETHGQGVGDVANKFIAWISIVASILAVIYLIVAGITYITAGGNPDQAKKGQQGVINAVIGIIIIVLAYFIATAIATTATHITG